ncbi:Chromatin-remodeling complexes subunit NGG1 [Purpureocillium lavendulum]|uniref:Chromatin-remodeling complexes subunit NGG1 n=1 Tax=Purpureocillium lavendulum TaxID=1247861 RepID=A0AB34FXY1_9HYPO|nr:Chromatin-remodeling complexes subunit NGG1 [Purpureocillium lavendulum]
MADHDAARLSTNGDGLLPPESRSRASYETGESSATGSLRGATPSSSDRRLLQVPRSDDIPRSASPDYNPIPRGSSLRRKIRPRSGGGFLLQDKVAAHRDASHRHAVRDASHHKARASPAPRTPESSRTRSEREDNPRESSDAGSGRRAESPNGKSPEASQGDEFDISSDSPPSRRSQPGLDVDSAQIVHMALNLSESRRIAARRTVSRGTPPRLAPVADGSSSGALRQHLQQQRRTSRNLSPKPGQVLSPRISSGAALSTPLQSSFDSGHDNQYRYHFSPSTLARAQKAKEHLELMAQYRRLLETLPPLKPGFDRQTTTLSPPSTAVASRGIRFGSRDPQPVPLGRQYNPLQYIRNRKIRARERKVIDGERQGFGDVDGVRLWIDKVYSRSSSMDSTAEGDAFSMPVYPGADEAESHVSPDAASKTVTRVRRSRVDWFIEPCDMIADAYWLERNDHKHLIEDRHWRKIFPPSLELSRPATREAEETFRPGSFEAENALDPRGAKITRVDTTLSQVTTKDRAKQKFQNMRAFPHRHTGSTAVHHHDLLRLTRDSGSDLSESENEGKDDIRRKAKSGRRGTISSDANDLLEKQMLEMVAREAREREQAESAVDIENIGSPKVTTSEKKPSSPSASHFHSRKGSLADTSDSDATGGGDISRLPSAASYHQTRLEDAPSRRVLQRVSSLPASPELRPVKEGVESAFIDTQLSPSRSRTGSPPRNTLSKIKHIMRDKSGDSAPLPSTSGLDQDGDYRMPTVDPSLTPDKARLPDRRRSSPTKKQSSEGKLEPWRSHRSSASLRLRTEDASRRGMFKGPRIDTVIRGGVSRLGDMLWKKEGSGESQPEMESTDESESERTRGRQRSSLSLSGKEASATPEENRQLPKHFLDAMPDFNHAPGYSRSNGDATPSGSTNHSRKSSRFDLLKPPRIDPRSASSSVSPPSIRRGRLGDSDASESESRQGSVSDGVRDADKRLNDALVVPGYDEDGRRRSRHWSIADKECYNEQARLSRREIARMKALILSSGIKALEISRRANEVHNPFGHQGLAAKGAPVGTTCAGFGWADIAQLSDDTQLSTRKVTFCELYPLAAQCLGGAIQASGQRWQVAADRFAHRTSPDLQQRIGEMRSRLVDDLSEMARAAADQADETSRDLALGQPLKVKHVVDVIEKMMRRRRRRLRWLRRALWLMVEWLLVGFMWYVWFVVMILRIFLGVGKGVWRGVRWLLWL